MRVIIWIAAGSAILLWCTAGDVALVFAGVFGHRWFIGGQALFNYIMSTAVLALWLFILSWTGWFGIKVFLRWQTWAAILILICAAFPVTFTSYLVAGRLAQTQQLQDARLIRALQGAVVALAVVAKVLAWFGWWRIMVPQARRMS